MVNGYLEELGQALTCKYLDSCIRSCCSMAAIIAPSYLQTPCSGGFFISRVWKPPDTMAQIRPKADYSHGRLPKMPPIELCFSLHMDRLWRKAPSFAVNRATRALKFPLSGHKDPQAAAAGGLLSETDGLGRKESGFGNGQQDRGVGGRVRARGVHGAGQGARARALLPVPGEIGRLAPRRAQVPLRGVRPGGYGRCGIPRARRGRGARGRAFRGPRRVVSRRPAAGRPRPAGKARSRWRPSSRSTSADIGTGPCRACAFFVLHTNIRTRMCACAYAWLHIYVFACLRVYASAHLGRYSSGCGREPAMDDHGGMAYGKERVSREAGRHGEDDGRR